MLMSSNSRNIRAPYRVAIIGAGRIASSFDTPDTRNILTHAHALSRDSRFSLAGMYDIDAVRAREEAHKWGTTPYRTVEELLNERPDVVVIATPDDTHASLLWRVAGAKPRLIVCEKPVGVTPEELKDLTAFPADIPVVVNFSRRFDRGLAVFRDALVSQEYGRVVSATGTYTNGVLHNGSHLMDLSRYLFGELLEVRGYYGISDHSESDPTVSGFASFERCPQMSFVAGDERAYAVFDFEILTEQKRFRLENFGAILVCEDAVPDPLYAGFRALGPRRTTQLQLLNALPELYTHVYQVLAHGAPVRSSLQDAVRAQEGCFQLLRSFQSS